MRISHPLSSVSGEVMWLYSQQRHKMLVLQERVPEHGLEDEVVGEVDIVHKT